MKKNSTLGHKNRKPCSTGLTDLDFPFWEVFFLSLLKIWLVVFFFCFCFFLTAFFFFPNFFSKKSQISGKFKCFPTDPTW